MESPQMSSLTGPRYSKRIYGSYWGWRRRSDGIRDLQIQSLHFLVYPRAFFGRFLRTDTIAAAELNKRNNLSIAIYPLAAPAMWETAGGHVAARAPRRHLDSVSRACYTSVSMWGGGRLLDRGRDAVLRVPAAVVLLSGRRFRGHGSGRGGRSSSDTSSRGSREQRPVGYRSGGWQRRRREGAGVWRREGVGVRSRGDRSRWGLVGRRAV
mmetsp:Transcript_9555/g.11816  ORF Transcript_9555/g.11816 Transcript_9555/m.11816 type:complete len:210 (+) Transcript_9555:1211-1840(+)